MQPSLDCADHGPRNRPHPQGYDRAHVLLLRVGEQALAHLAPEGHAREVPDPQARPAARVGAHDEVLDLPLRTEEAGAAQHRLHPAALHAHQAGVPSGPLQRDQQVLRRQSPGGEARGIKVHLELAHHAARGRHLGHPRDAAQRRGHEVVEHPPALFHVAGPLQGEGVDLPHRGRVRSQPRRHARRQEVAELTEAFEYAVAAGVEVPFFFEDEVHVARAVKRQAAHGDDPRQALQLARQPRRHLPLDVLWALAGPFGPDDDLIVAQVRDRVDRDSPPRPQAGAGERQSCAERQEGMSDDGGEHRREGRSGRHTTARGGKTSGEEQARVAGQLRLAVDQEGTARGHLVARAQPRADHVPVPAVALLEPRAEGHGHEF